MEIQTVEFHRAAYKPEDFPRDGRPQFAIVGRSNVGKSSVINAILRSRKLARVSQTPGKTQAIHFYLVNDRFYIVDLPGYGYAKVARVVSASWGELTRGYFESADALVRIFLLIDSRRVPSGDDLQMVDWMSVNGLGWRVIMTKVDKLSNNERVKNRKGIAAELGIEPAAIIDFSKNTREGLDKIWRELGEGLNPK